MPDVLDLENKYGLSHPIDLSQVKFYQVFLGDTLIAVVPASMLDGFLACVFKANHTKVSLSEYIPI